MTKSEETTEGIRSALAQKGIKISGENLTEAQRLKLERLLFDNLDIFATSLSELPGTDLVKHHIDVGDSKPIQLRAYRQSPAVKREMQKQVDDMLKSGIIEECDSAWSSPSLLVKKANNEYRFVTDFRQVNKDRSTRSPSLYFGHYQQWKKLLIPYLIVLLRFSACWT